VCSHQYN